MIENLNDLKENLEDGIKTLGNEFLENISNLHKHITEYSVGFLPKETGEHLLNMNKELLLAVRAVIDNRLGNLKND